jgi:protein-tyrosine phosphatase
MIDIHCHILSGLDDGASDLQESVAMAKLAYKDGIRHIIATPHFTESIMSRAETRMEKIEELRQALKRARINVAITPGNEVRIESAEFVYDHEAAGSYHYLTPDKRFILLEQRWSAFNERTEEICRWFLSRGTTPILAHPERHVFFRERPELLHQLLDLGVWTQVTVDSLLGKNGVQAELFGRELVRAGRAHVLATDAHNTKRKPNLSQGIRVVREIAGQEQTKALLERMDIIRRSAEQWL